MSPSFLNVMLNPESQCPNSQKILSYVWLHPPWLQPVDTFFGWSLQSLRFDSSSNKNNILVWIPPTHPHIREAWPKRDSMGPEAEVQVLALPLPLPPAQLDIPLFPSLGPRSFIFQVWGQTFPTLELKAYLPSKLTLKDPPHITFPEVTSEFTFLV